MDVLDLREFYLGPLGAATRRIIAERLAGRWPGLKGARLLGLGLAGVWLATIRAWARDDSADMAATMAALDNALDRAERIARSLGLLRGDGDPTISEPVAETS